MCSLFCNDLQHIERLYVAWTLPYRRNEGFPVPPLHRKFAEKAYSPVQLHRKLCHMGCHVGRQVLGDMREKPGVMISIGVRRGVHESLLEFIDGPECQGQGSLDVDLHL